jgi:hypothetical protein
MSYRVPEHVAFRSVDDEIVLFEATTEAYHGLNASAAAVWTILADGGDLAAAIDGLVERFDVAREAAAGDVAALIERLVARGLLLRAFE